MNPEQTMRNLKLKDAPVVAGFERRRIFNALKAHDVMHHRAVYRLLADMLLGFGRPIRLLDIGCGDAADILPVLLSCQVSGYVGVDTSAEAIAMVSDSLAVAPFPVRLIQGDFREVLSEPSGSFDVIWMGLFLHHLPHEFKAGFLADAYRLLAPGGLLLAHDPMPADGEERAAFIARLEAHGRAHWHFLDEAAIAMVGRHWSAHGHQESFSSLRHLGLAAGFGSVDLLWADPDAFYGLACFRNP